MSADNGVVVSKLADKIEHDGTHVEQWIVYMWQGESAIERTQKVFTNKLDAIAYAQELDNPDEMGYSSEYGIRIIE